MTAPDPGLTDLIAAELVRSSPNSIDTFDLLPYHRQEAWRVRAREVALVVEQHTNGRMASDLGADPQDYDIAWAAKLRWQARAEKAEATIARVGAVIEDLVQNIADDEKTLRSPNVSVGEAQELPAVISVQQIYLEELRAALEGEQQ